MNMNPIVSLAALSEPLEAYEMVLLGFFFVLFVLTSLAFLTWLVGKILHRSNHKARSKDEKEADNLVMAHAAEGQMGSVDEDDEDAGDEKESDEQLKIFAAISAAVHLVLKDQRFRVRTIRPVDHSWAQEGRRQIFSSHRLR